MVFGWKRKDRRRRFRNEYQEVTRKNGKSTLLAGIGLLLQIVDGEFGAEVYAVDVGKEQDEMYNLIESGMAARKQPLLWMITTAGFNKDSSCRRERDSVVRPHEPRTSQ